MENLYVFAIGGTGARCLESLIYLSAMGLGPSKIIPIMIDPDAGNGNLNKTIELINLYREIKENIISDSPNSLFYTKIEDKKYWNPLEDETEKTDRSKALKDLISYNKLNENDKRLVNLFYSKDELELDLDYGFRGVPAIGSIVMQKITEEDFFKKLVSKIETDPNKNKAFIFSSIFGGTGASGYPTIAKLISDIGNSSIGGGSVIFPYFQLPRNNTGDNIAPDSDNFIINSISAIPFYKNLGTRFTNYIIGDDVFSNITEYQIGGGKQKNNSHFIELFAALAALDFNFNHRKKGFFNIKKVLQNDDTKAPITEEDIPNPKKSQINFIDAIERFTLFSIYFKDIFGDLNNYSDNKTRKMLKNLAWLSDNLALNVEEINENKKELEKILRFNEHYNEWYSEMHDNERKLNIFNKDFQLKNLIISNPSKYSKHKIDYLDYILVKTNISKSNVINKIVEAIQHGTEKFQKLKNK